MELDELKHTWKGQNEKGEHSNENIMKLIQNKSYGPLATLKRRFGKQMVLVPAILTVVIVNLSRNHELLSDALFWFYVIFCIGISVYFLISYRLVHKMESLDGQVKEQLQTQLKTLEQGIRWRLILTRATLLVFFIFLEVMMFLKQEPSLVKWYAQPVYLRLLGYVGIFVAFYLLSEFAFNRRYVRHVKYLKELVQQME